jgi:hypothetical protein
MVTYKHCTHEGIYVVVMYRTKYHEVQKLQMQMNIYLAIIKMHN